MLRPKLYIIAKELFQFSVGVYLFLLLGESMKEGFVSLFINLAIILAIVIVSGFLMMVTYTKYPTQQRESSMLVSADVEKAILFSFVGSFVVYSITKDLGWISYTVAGLSAVILLFIILLIYKEQQ